jgi:toxin ParE1/3/4
MSGRILKRDSAKLAIIEIADFLSHDNILVAAGFIEAVQRTLEFLAGMPEVAAKWETDQPRLKDVRVWHVDGFSNHLIFYRPIADGIELIYVCHASRNLDKLLENL